MQTRNTLSLITSHFFSPAALKCSKNGCLQWNILMSNLLPKSTCRATLATPLWGFICSRALRGKDWLHKDGERETLLEVLTGESFVPSPLNAPRMCEQRVVISKNASNMMNWWSWHQLYGTKCYTLSDRHLQVLHLLPAKTTSASPFWTFFQFYSNLYFAGWVVSRTMYSNRRHL